MKNWSAGYVADIGYTFGYYRELNPLRIKLAFLNAGLVYPEFGTACELGFGQGVSANVHAAATMTNWFGTDFLPEQAGFAQSLANSSGSGATLLDQSFAEFTTRDDLPDFDFIGLHGIWSWVSDENRHLIVDFVRRKLKVGGVLYIGYNTLPGWSSFAPMRHLLAEHALVQGGGSGVENKIDNALQFAQNLVDTNPLYVRANPTITDRMKKLHEQNRQYLAHEYFNRDWHPMYFSTFENCFEPAKLTYACGAHFLDQIDSLNLTEQQQAFLNAQSNPSLKETVRDYMVNQQFRRDYWVKGARKLTKLEQIEQLKEQLVVMVVPREDITLKVTGALGEGEMSAELYNPVLDLLADFKVRSLEEIIVSVESEKLDFAKLVQIIIVLAGVGHIAPAQEPKCYEVVKKRTDKLNLQLMSKARTSDEVGFLASPVLGAGVAVARFSQIFLLGIRKKLTQPDQWAKFAWAILNSQSQKIVKDGKRLDKDEDNLAELTKRALEFERKHLPILKALQVI